MVRNKTGLLLAGLAAYAAYRYSKMNADQKKNMLGSIKEKGKDLVDRYVPDSVKSKFSQAATADESHAGFKPGF